MSIRKLVMPVMIAVTASGPAATSALATTETMTPYGQIYAGGTLAARHSLTQVYGTSLNGSVYACVTAFNSSDGSQAGTSDCQPFNTLAYHAYNGTLRNAFIYPSPNYTIAGSGYFSY